MTTARILTITDAGPVPNSDRLSVFRVLGYDAVSANNDEGQPRFSKGERVVYVAEGSRVPEAMLKAHGFWGFHKDRQVEMGMLSGPNGDVVKPVTLRGQMSTGLLWKLPDDLAHLPDTSDVSDYFGITEWIPPVPAELLKVAMPLTRAKLTYEIARLKTYPDFFTAEDEVVVTEKLEGECLQMTWLGNEPVEGAHADGRIAITTKGLGRQGLAFKECEDSESIPIIRAVRNSDLIAKFEEMVHLLGAQDQKVRLLCEAIGPGVKKLHYGAKDPVARAFDVRIDEDWLTEDKLDAILKTVDIERAPVLWRGLYDADVIEELRQGNTTLNDKHIREGVVIKAIGDQSKRRTSLGESIRPVLKAHSDTFLKKFGKDD